MSEPADLEHRVDVLERNLAELSQRISSSEGKKNWVEKITGTFEAAMQVLPFDREAAELYESLRKQRVRIGAMDLRIAATALAHGYRVLTRNTKDFYQVPGLPVEDWTTA